MHTKSTVDDVILIYCRVLYREHSYHNNNVLQYLFVKYTFFSLSCLTALDVSTVSNLLSAVVALDLANESDIRVTISLMFTVSW